MIEFILSMTPTSWWILIVLFIGYFLIPFIKKLEFNNQSSAIKNKRKSIDYDTTNKFKEHEYFALCLDLMRAWQWQVKMKLNIPFQSFGHDQINQHIIEKFTLNDKNWASQLLRDNLTFEEKHILEKTITLKQYHILQNTIRLNLGQDNNHD